MSEQRYGYTYHRVLIESARVLSPQFSDAVIYVTGAQLEMLRNMTQYLNRLTTYVSDYQPGYYLSPTVEDYDDILAIVSDLEDVLMGNPNTIWGYSDRWQQYRGLTKSGAGDHTFEITTVPAGYVYVLNAIKSTNDTTVTDHIHLLYDGTRDFQLAVYEDVPADTWQVTDRLNHVLKAGDKIRATILDCLDGDVIRAQVWGYMMVVPE